MEVVTNSQTNKHFAGRRMTRFCINIYFFMFGFLFATWASRIPAIQQNLHLDEAGLGAVLLAMPVGSFLAVPFSGYFSSAFGSRKVCIMSGISYCILLIAIGVVNVVWLLAVILFLFGAAANILNIAINTQAIALEKHYSKTIISSFHGVWSVAGLVAAAVGTVLIAHSVSVIVHFFVIGVFSAICMFTAFFQLYPDHGGVKEIRKIFTRPNKALWLLGVIAFSSLICQGAMFDWSGVYFKKVLNAPKAYIGFGYTAFMASMTGIRFLTDWITYHIGFRRIIIICGFFAVAGLVITILLPSVLFSTIGMFLVGVGVSPTVPLVFSAAGKLEKLSPPVAIAAVSSIGMVGLLIGPPFIGFVAAASSLKVSFAILIFFGIAITVSGFMKRD